MRVVITGHLGFIGSHLTAHLITHGYDVVGLDRAEGDLLHPGFFEARLRDTQPDMVVHLAAKVGRLNGEASRRDTVRANAEMTAVIAAACGEHGVPLTYASTSEVYGDQGNQLCYESGRLALPHNAYGLTKLWGETACQLYAPEGLRILRLSMPYGTGMPPGRGRAAMVNVLWQAANDLPIPIHRGAERSWCHVKDTVRGIRLILENEPGIYNVGRDDNPVPMRRLAEWACAMTGAPFSLIRDIDPPPMQTVVKRLSTDKLRKLGWKPEIELPEGMSELLDWVSNFDAEGRWIKQAARRSSAAFGRRWIAPGPTSAGSGQPGGARRATAAFGLGARALRNVQRTASRGTSITAPSRKGYGSSTTATTRRA